MSFVPVTGSAVFEAASPPRESSVAFADARRTVSLPMKAALPVLRKAYASTDASPSVALVAAAAHLGLRLVAGGRLEPGSGCWLPVLGADDEERLRLLATSRAYDGCDAAAAEQIARGVVAAVVDAVPASPPKAATGAGFRESLESRLARYRTEGPVTRSLPSLVRLSLRIEAAEEDLLLGTVRAVPQVHDVDDALHVADLAALWDDDAEHGFGPRAQVHARVALQAAADAWPVLERLAEMPVPTSIVLETDEISSLLEDGAGWLAARGVDVLWPHALGRELTTSVEVERAAGVREDLMRESPLGEKGLFAFRWQVALDGEPLTDAEMETLARAAGPVLRLRGSWAVVPPAVLRRARKRLLKRISGGEALAVALTGAVPEEVAAAAEGEQVVVGASIGRLRDAVVEATSGQTPVPVPEGLTATLRDYQREGLTWLAGITSLGLGGCLADDMGLGKTVTTIALHLHRVSTGSTSERRRPTLVVCPASLLGNWEAELARFAPGVDVRRHHGASRDLEGAEVVLTTYQTMRRDLARLAGVEWGLVVADEAQHVKNAASATAKALRDIPSHARVALTGTPVENNLSELWAILDWCVPGLLGSRRAFRRAWASQIEAGADVGKAKQFAALVSPFLLRRRKSDPGVAPELPEKTETDHLLALTREQTVLYEAYVRDAMERIRRLEPTDPERRGLVLAMLTALKQICNHPAQFLRQEGGHLAGRSQKVALLDELIPTVAAEGGAMLVFTQYVALGRLLSSHWSAGGVPHLFLHGGTSVAERERMVASFQAGEVPVFLLSLKAGGVGLNLTRADHVVHVDRWWNPAVEDQATDRAHRIGQTRPVQVHRLVTAGTLEERIGELLARKRVLAEAVLGRGEAAFTELSDAELAELVRLKPQPRRRKRRIAS